MKEFVSEESQIKQVKAFSENLKLGIDLKRLLIPIGKDLNLLIKKIKNIIINGEKIEDSKIYSSHLSIFKNIFQKNFKPKNLLKLFEIDEKNLFNKDNTPQEKLKAIGMCLQDKKPTEEEIIQHLIKKVLTSPKINDEINKILFCSNQELNELLNALNDYLHIDLENENENQIIKNYVSLKLYSDAFEIFLKIIKEAYSKQIGIKIKDIKNDKMYDWLEKNYPLLLESTNNKLRNDICHMNYKERGKYSLNEINEEKQIIILKAYTGIIAKYLVVIEYFDKTIEEI